LQECPIAQVNTFGSKIENGDGKHGEDRFKSKQCYVCQGRHYIDECQRFRDVTPNERWKIVKEQRACFSCLKRGKGHTVANCSRKKECGEKLQSGGACNKHHHKLLHVNANVIPTRSHIGYIHDGGGALLPVLLGQVKGKMEQILQMFSAIVVLKYQWYVKTLPKKWGLKEDSPRKLSLKLEAPKRS
jgi:hypothetical protein